MEIKHCQFYYQAFDIKIISATCDRYYFANKIEHWATEKSLANGLFRINLQIFFLNMDTALEVINYTIEQ